MTLPATSRRPPTSGLRGAPRATVRGVRRAAGYAPFLRRRATAYIGWAGHGNLGDEAMLAAHRSLLGPTPVRQVPPGGDGRALRALGRADRFAAVCLGGGTLIHNGHFRTVLGALLAAAPDAPRLMLSVGVEDPDYLRGRRAGVATEAALWTPLLREFPVVRVRGPRSARALGDAGLDVQVVGDPALGLELPADLPDPLDTPDTLAPSDGGPSPAPAGRPPVVGVNAGLTDDLWGGDEEGFLDEVRALVDRLVGRGWEVRLVSTTTADTPPLRRLAAEVPGAVPPGPDDLGTTLRALAGCDVVVGEKLHALVLAARLGVPGVAMEYRPKCRDFQESVGRERYTQRTDELSAGSLTEMVDEVLADLPAQRAALVGEVAGLVGALRRAAADARGALAGSA